MMRRVLLTVSTLALAISPVVAQEAIQEVIEEEASAEETASVVAAMEQVGCALAEGGAVEKESANLFEVDDAFCDFIGAQYDFKLDGTYNITSITYDGPVDPPGAEGVMADKAVGEEIEDWLDNIGCRIEDDEVEQEGEELFEIDDGECDYGQFDIKIGRKDGQLVLRSMTRD